MRPSDGAALWICVGVALLLFATEATAQDPPGPSFRMAAGVPLSVGLEVHLSASSRVNLLGSAQFWREDVSCLQFGSTGCSATGVSLGGGVRLHGPRAGQSGPFAQIEGGRHLYTAMEGSSTFFSARVGIVRYLGPGGAIEFGAKIARILGTDSRRGHTFGSFQIVLALWPESRGAV